VYMSID